MNRFSTVREAMEYLVSRILLQADRDGVQLTDVERKMLYFSETGWTLPDMMDVNREFDENYDQDEYEMKIRKIVRRIYDEPDSDNSWDEAVDRIRDEDHYLQVLIGGVFRKSDKFTWGDKVRVVLAASVVVAVILPVSFFVFSRVDNKFFRELIVGTTLLALVVPVSIWASRGSQKSD